MRQTLDEWYDQLPDMEGHEQMKKLLWGRKSRGDLVWVVVDRLGENYLRLVYLDEATLSEPKCITADAGPREYFEVVDRFGQVTLDILAAFVHNMEDWEYEPDDQVEDVVKTFLNAKAIADDASWEAHVAEVFAELPEEEQYWVEEVPSPPGNLHDRMRLPLLGYVYHLRSLDDPRALVAELERRETAESVVPQISGQRGLVLNGSELRITARADVNSDGLRRKLAAVLPGVVVSEVEDDEAEQAVVVLQRGEYDLDGWQALDKETINDLLIELDNEPVVAVRRGDHAMQVLIALPYRVTELDVAECLTLDVITHAAVAQPEWVYGGRVISAISPETDLTDEEEFAELEDRIRFYMRFFA